MKRNRAAGDMKKKRAGTRPKEGGAGARRHGFLVGLTAAALLIALCLLLFPVRYETNDDFANVRRLTALSGFEADAFSPVLSPLLSGGLYRLYRAAPGVPWYGLSVYLALFVGIFLMASVLARHGDGRTLLICVPGLLLFFSHAILLLNFTTAALLSEVGAFAALAEWGITGVCPARRPRLYAALLGGAVALGYLLRWELALWGIAFGIPALLFFRRSMTGALWPVALALIALIAADRAVVAFARPRADRAYMTYNELRRVFNDTAKGDYYAGRTPGALEKAGWSREDYLTYKRWMLYDDALFNAKTLKAFLTKNDPQESASLLSLIPRRLEQSFQRSRSYTLVFLCSLGALLLLFLPGLSAMGWREALGCLLPTGIIFSMIVFFAYYRFEPRIYLPLFSYALVLSCLVWTLRTLPKRSGKAGAGIMRGALLTMAAILTLVSYGYGMAQAKDISRMLDASARQKRYVTACLERLKSATAGQDPILILMDPTAALSTEDVNPVKEMADYPAVRLMPAGTGVNSPRYHQILGSLGLRHGRDFLKWTIDNDRALFVLLSYGSAHQKAIVSMWQSYYDRHIAGPSGVRLKPVMDFRNRSGAGLIVYRMASNGA